MIDAARLRERMSYVGLSQAELARRIGVSQATVNKLAVGHSYGSKHLHRIARELVTSPAYLEGETDDPDKDAPPPIPPPAPRILVELTLPPEDALTSMFVGMLNGLDPAAPVDERARLLARRLPIAMSQLRDLAPAAMMASAARRASPARPEAHATLPQGSIR